MPRAPKRSELRRSGGAVMQEAGPVVEAASHAEVAKGEQPESVPLQPKFAPLTAFEQSGKKLEFRRVCSQATDPSHSGACRRTHTPMYWVLISEMLQLAPSSFSASTILHKSEIRGVYLPRLRGCMPNAACGDICGHVVASISLHRSGKPHDRGPLLP